MEGIGIASDTLAQVRAEAAAMPSSEICGFLLGTPGRITRAVPTANVSPTPTDSFEVDPVALFTALRGERAGGPQLLGHYHSHPNGRAEPSPRDLAAAEPGRLWLIVGGGDVRLWRAEAGGFREVALRVA